MFLELLLNENQSSCYAWVMFSFYYFDCLTVRSFKVRIWFFSSRNVSIITDFKMDSVPLLWFLIQKYKLFVSNILTRWPYYLFSWHCLLPVNFWESLSKLFSVKYGEFLAMLRLLLISYNDILLYFIFLVIVTF